MSDRLPDFYEITKEIERKYGRAEAIRQWEEVNERLKSERVAARKLLTQMFVAAIILILFCWVIF